MRLSARSFRRSSTSIRRLLAFVFALAIGVAGCGSGSDAIDAEATPTTATPASGGEEDHDDDGDHDGHGDEDDHDDEGSSGLGAHEHGQAELSVALVDADVSIDLVSPTFNIFGFEYEPESDEDIELAEDRTEALTADGLLVINSEAGCTLAGPAGTEVEREGSHSEITVSWSFTCENPDEISQLDLAALFAEFGNFEDIDAQWISATEQSAAELSPDSPVLRFKS